MIVLKFTPQVALDPVLIFCGSFVGGNSSSEWILISIVISEPCQYSAH